MLKRYAKKLGFSFDAGLMQFKDGAIQIYRLTKVDKNTGDSLILDMLLVTDELQKTWESRQRLKWDQGAIPVVSPEGLIQLKSFRQSGQDQDDIKHLRKFIDES